MSSVPHNGGDSSPEKRPAHRPVGTLRTERTATIPVVRCTPEQRERFDALGGADWLRGALDKARLPRS